LKFTSQNGLFSSLMNENELESTGKAEEKKDVDEE
jgi:hypothetical protein